jgi:hypothetical protein
MIGPKQNTSHAVMAQRNEAKDSLDDFPTPPWATRTLLEHVIQDREALCCIARGFWDRIEAYAASATG